MASGCLGTQGVSVTFEGGVWVSIGDQGTVDAEQGVFTLLDAADRGSLGDQGRVEIEEGVRCSSTKTSWGGQLSMDTQFSLASLNHR